MLAGFAVKFALGVVSIPFLYSSYIVKTRREILEEEAEAILFSIGDGLVMTDRKGKIIVVNKAFEDILGWKVEEVVGKPLADVLQRYDEAGNMVPYKEFVLSHVLSGEKLVTPMTNNIYFAKKDGTKFPVRIVVTPVMIDQAIMGAVEVFQDVTKEKEIDNLRNDFLSLASHQLRTPLSGTRWIIENLQKGITGEMNEKQKEYLENLHQLNTRMTLLVSDMLEVLHVESGKVQVAKKILPASKVFADVIPMMQAASKAKNITLEKRFADKKPIIGEIDPKLTGSIVSAFISNAISYSNEGGTVILDAQDSEKEIVFSVQDDGLGIPKNEQKRIFEKFYRASNASLVKTDGTGLGLYIASVLAKKIGAKVRFESTEGKGSTFSLHIQKS